MPQHVQYLLMESGKPGGCEPSDMSEVLWLASSARRWSRKSSAT